MLHIIFDFFKNIKEEPKDEVFSYKIPKSRFLGKSAKFEAYKDKGGKYRWRVRDNRDNIIAASQQGFETKQIAVADFKYLRLLILSDRVEYK